MRFGSVYMLCTFFRTVLASSESRIALPSDLLILAWPSVPGSVSPSTRSSGIGKTSPYMVIEAAGDLAGDLDVRLVVLADRHQVGARQQDVGGLEHRVAQQPERDRLLVQQRGAGHVLDAWQTRQPRHRHQVAEEQRQLVGLVHRRLEEDGGLGRVDARAEVVQHHAAGVIRGRVDVLRLFLVVSMCRSAMMK